jgi:hypothetical protein
LKGAHHKYISRKTQACSCSRPFIVQLGTALQQENEESFSQATKPIALETGRKPKQFLTDQLGAVDYAEIILLVENKIKLGGESRQSKWGIGHPALHRRQPV